MEKVYKYYAFISYKHADEKWAKWLQHRLETYRLPVALQKQNCPKRLAPVFRDNTDLTPGNLEKKLQESLELSHYLIVICSRNLAKESHYIDFEMQTFIDMGRANKIIPFIVDGEPNSDDPENECFSEFIKQFPGELLAASIPKDGKNIASLKVIAAILNLDANDLIRRDKQRIFRQRVLSLAATIFIATLLSALLDLMARNYEKEAENSYLYNDTQSAVSNAVKSLQTPFHKDASSNAAVILRNEVISNELKQSSTQFHKDYEVRTSNKGVTLFVESTDGTKVGFSDCSRIYVYDAKTGKYLREFNGTMDLSEEEKEEFNSYFGTSYEECYQAFISYGTFVDYVPVHHTETIEEAGTWNVLCVQDKKGNLEQFFYIHKQSATWTYTENENMIALYPIEGNPSIAVYSFEHDIPLTLECPNNKTGVSDMYFSPKGRYLFVKYYQRDANGTYGDYSLCVYDLESRDMIFQREDDSTRRSILKPWCFSNAENREALYIFSSYRVEKYSFEDREPAIVNTVLCENESGYALCEKNHKLDNIHFSEDGTKAVSIHEVSGFGEDSYERKTLYTFFKIHTGEQLESILFNSSQGIIDITPDLRYVFYYLDDHLILYDLDASSVLLNVNCGDESVCSVAISKDGKHAAYITDDALITIFSEINGSYQAKTIQGFESYEQKTILFVNQEECFVNSDTAIRAYNIVTGDMRMIQKDVWQYPPIVESMTPFDVFKSYCDLEDQNIFLNRENIERHFSFYDKNGENIPINGGSSLLNGNYCPENGLLIGTEYTNQMQYNNELVVFKLDGKSSKILYRYTSKLEIRELCFDNRGKYIIINGYEDEGCEVIDAMTGELLFELDRRIRIHNDIVYDISTDLVLPDSLPHAEICSIDQFIKKGTALLG